MDNGEAVEEEEVIPINSTIKIRVTSHSEVVAMVNESNVEETVNLVDNNKDENESTLLLALKENTDDCSLCYLDYGASNHMCGHKVKFVEIKKTVKEHLCVALKGATLNFSSSESGADSYCDSSGLKRRANYTPALGDNLKTLGEHLITLTFSQDEPQERRQC
ncbi:hypothetical protein H5410_022684 [Solanum commersonii]|uniref:Uncharacterized protein n=1 Tax=Solanum commersonii TaxID=4109 RepID=A0A9J5ZER1_SOLCO|nr:hypothetical protein H5410_022684 [Solanum commersonii]